MATKTTAEVLQHHGQAIMSGNIEMIVQDYTKDSVLYTPAATYKGLDGIKTGFTTISKMLTPEVMAAFKMIKQEINGEYAYMLWSAPPSIPFAGDTFHVHNGKILMQSVIFQAGR
jgi:ketosteroid isomerase-like protein